MKIDLSGVLYAELRAAQKKYDEAKARNDIGETKKFAQILANTEKQLADKLPDQRRAHIDKAQKWEEIVRTAGTAPRRAIVERGDKGGGDEDNLSGFGESLIEKSSVTWKDIGGLDEIKDLIQETIVIAGLTKPESVKPDKGILLFGPPGTGKTLLAAAAAGSLRATFFNVKVSSVLSKYFGESSKMITALYESARIHSPSIVFIDEFDSITMSRDGDQGEASRKVLSTLLAELDGFQDKKSDKLILTLAATNTPEDLDQAVLSRFPKRIYIKLPDKKSCHEIIKLQVKGLDSSAIDFEKLAEMCVVNRYSGRDLQNVCKDAIRSMIHRSNTEIFDDIDKMAELSFEELKKRTLKVSPLTMDDFSQSIAKVKSPLTTEKLASFEKWNKEYGAA